MFIPAMLAGDQLWYLLPLALAVSFSYTASRYESRDVIIWRSVIFFAKTIFFMAVIFVVLYLLGVGL